MIFYQTSNQVYERLDELGADTAEAKASHLLKGLGFNTAMQNKKCKDYSGGWRMRIGKKYLIYYNQESKNGLHKLDALKILSFHHFSSCSRSFYQTTFITFG